MKGFVSLIWKTSVCRGNKSIPTTAPEARKTRWQHREAGKGGFEVILVLRCQSGVTSEGKPSQVFPCSEQNLYVSGECIAVSSVKYFPHFLWFSLKL